MRRKIRKSCNYHKDQSLEECHALLTASVANFTRLGLLNDEGYLRGMIHSLTRRGLSRAAILAKLSMKGFSNETVLNALQIRMEEHADNATNYDLVAALRHAQRKKLGPFRTKTDYDRNKELASLARAGFGYDVAEKTLSQPYDTAQKMLADFL
jgi:regulatory protein